VKVCPSGWSEFGSHCYQFRTTNHNWKTAEADCVSAGGHLASFHSQAEDAFINKLAGIPRIWLGSSDASSEVLCVKKKIVKIFHGKNLMMYFSFTIDIFIFNSQFQVVSID
jgi:hypothetical protein